MKRLAIAGMLLVSLTTLVACDSENAETSQEERMQLVETDYYGKVLRDNRTGVMYFAADGVCVMVDADGKPLVMEEKND